MDQSIAQIIQDAATKNGVDPQILGQIAAVESGGNANAAASGSSAKGLFQVTDPTWKEMGGGDNPLDPSQNADVGARLLKRNSDGLSSAGIDASAPNLYLSHFAGLGGARKLLQADPSASAASVLGDAAVSANPFLKNMSVADLQGWAARKMNATAQARPTTGILNQPAPSPSSAPGLLNGATPEPDDTAALQLAFAKATQQPQAQQVAPLAPIQYAIPKHVDRAKLLAALTRKVA